MCTNVARLLLVFVERVSSSLPIDSSGSGSSTIARSARMHLAGMGRVNLVNFSTYLHRLARVVAMPMHPVNRDDNNINDDGLERSGVGPGHCRTRILRC